MANISRLIATHHSRVIKQAEINAKAVGAFLQAKLRDQLNRPYPPASRPGEFPARRSGRLQRESYAESRVVGDSIVVTMAQPTPYAQRLVGSGRLGPRAVVEQNRAQVEQMLLRDGFNNLERHHRGG